MAGSISPKFLQTASVDKAQKNLSNFQVRTGQKFGDIAKQKLFEQGLVEDKERQEQQARTALEFRKADEQKRQFDEKAALAQQSARREKSREKFDVVKTIGTIAKAFT